jgi:hypothetical protein
MIRNIVTVFSFTVYDINSDKIKLSPRKATRDAIARAQGTLLEETAQEVDEAHLDGNGFLLNT